MNKAQLAIYILFVVAVIAMLSMITIVFYVYFRELEMYTLPGDLTKTEHVLLPDENITEKEIEEVILYVKSATEDVPTVPSIPVSISYNAKWYDPPSEVSGTALCFSGGGVMAMTHCIGFIRGFLASGYLSKAKLISAASGSCWAIIPGFLVSTTHEQNNISLDKLFGTYISPEEETIGNLKTPFPETSLAYMSTNPGNLARFMRLSVDNLKITDIPRNMIMADAFAQLVLRHLNMYCHTSLVQSDKESLDNIVNDNPELAENIENTFVTRDNLPPFTVSMTGYFPPICGMVDKNHEWPGKYQAFPMEYTADRAGFLCSCVHLKHENERMSIGNQISNYAWNSESQKSRHGTVNCTQDMTYNITGIHQMVSVTSFVFGSSFIQHCLDADLVPSQKCSTNISDNQKIWAADGGAWDNSAMTAALARKMPHLVVFCLDSALNVDKDQYPLSLAQPFGMKMDGTPDPKRTPLLDPKEFKSTAENIEKSQYDKYAMDHQYEWHPAIYTQTYHCYDVDVAGIIAYEPKITWVVPRRTYQYQCKLRPDVYKLVENIAHYPAFTTQSNLTSLYDLTPIQAQSVVSMDSWIAKEILSPMLESM
jgi:hypothetical protein